MKEGLSDELALRIGVAARCLPGVGVAGLMAVLVDALGLPITAGKLDRLTLNRLRHAGRGALADLPGGQLARALSYLRGKASVRVLDTPVPPVEPYRDGDLAHSLRVAVASDDGERLDGDFMTARRFLIYQVSPAELRLVAVRENPGGGGREDRKRTRLGQVADCRLVYAASIGAAAGAALAGAGIHPVVVPVPLAAREALVGLRQTLARRPPPWLAKAAGLAGRGGASPTHDLAAA
jgi:predicted Fe-Mo cluster-binding NifX family protein